MQELGAHAARLHRQRCAFLREMGRHLAAPGAGVGGRSPGPEQLLPGVHAEAQGQGAVAVIAVHLVRRGVNQCARRGTDRFVAGGIDLEERLVLPLEADFPVVDLSGGEHHPVGVSQLFRR